MNPGRRGQITVVRRSREYIFLEWRIYDFLDIPDGHLDTYESHRFSFSDVCWYFTVSPNWISSPGWVHIAIYRDDGFFSPQTFNFAFGIKGTDGVEKRIEAENTFSTDSRAWCKKQFVKRSELIDQKDRLMPNHYLTITCEMTVPGTTTRDFSAQTDILDVQVQNSPGKQDSSAQTEDLEVDETKKTSAKQGGEKALDDFGKLLASGDWSDITVQVGATEFMAHSFVLFARCPALSISLRHETKEKDSSKIVVEDCDPDVFQLFLHYLYTGSVASLMERTVFGLYELADRYLVEDLKRQCLERIENMLSIETFCDCMRLATTHDERGLLQRATDFASRNIRHIVLSRAWQDFICEHPIVANEIFIKSLGIPNVSKE